MAHGGKRPGAGRPSKAEEYKLIEKLDKYIDQQEVFEKLGELISKGQLKAIEIYLNYYFGRPTEKVQHSTDGESIVTPMITLIPANKKDE